MADAAVQGMAQKQNCEHENEELGNSVMHQENPNPETGIQRAMKVVASMNEDLFLITQTIRERQHDVYMAYEHLYPLEYREKSFRRSFSEDRKKLASLKRDLDKLTFANNAYKERAIKTEDKINTHNLYFVMHHGTKNMAIEKKLLKQVDASQKKLPENSDSDLSVVKEINNKIWDLRWNIDHRSYFFRKPATRVDEKQVLKEIEELKWARDKVFANAPVKGTIWNSFPSKNVLTKQIELMEKALPDEFIRKREEHLQLKASIKVIKKEINDAKQEINCLKRQLLDVHKKKGEAHKVILKLIKIQNQPI